MIDALFITLLVVAALTRSGPVMIFVTLSILHDIFFGEHDGFWYYGTAAFFDYLTIILINRTNFIQIVCLLSIMLNISGYIAWFLYYDASVYGYSFVILYSCAIVAAIFKDDDSGLGYNNRCIDVRHLHGRFSRAWGSNRNSCEIGS